MYLKTLGEPNMKPKYMHLGELYVIEGSDELELEVPANPYNWA
jgi:hypothetical protein